MSAVLSLKPSYYEALKRLTLELAGVNLGQNYEFLIETRLSALARQEGYDSLGPMIEELFSSGQTRLAVHVVSALLERDTQFNHERESLDDIIETVLPALHRLYKGTTLRILAYGCSSGQEPYSIAMALEKNMDLFPGLKYEIVALDYPSVALDRARAGRYTHFDVQRGLPIKDLITFFDRSAEDWVVKDTLREKVEFKDFHLLSKLELLGQFHLVVFRNRLKQYSAPAQIRVLRELASVVRELGFLVLGREEGVVSLNFGLEKLTDLPNVLTKREVIVEKAVEPNVKLPNGRTTFDGAKCRATRARSELSEMRPSQIKPKPLPVDPPATPPRTRTQAQTPPSQPQPKAQNVRQNTQSSAYVSAPMARPPSTPVIPPQQKAAKPSPPPKTEAAETEALEFELESLFDFEDMSQRRKEKRKT